VFLLLLLFASTAELRAQDSSRAQQSLETLRSQLSDIEAKQAALEGRMRELDEAMRPENIERSLALTGSTRPEELREKRRQQLEKEKAGVQAHLDQLATSRSRLQAAIAAAETAAYQQSGAANTPASEPQTGTTTTAAATQTTPAAQTQPRTTRRRARRARTKRRS
jgi:DNA repair exonuclease SbcCD ATPase subunit